MYYILVVCKLKFDYTLCETTLNRVSTAKDLCVWLDDELSFSEYINFVVVAYVVWTTSGIKAMQRLESIQKKELGKNLRSTGFSMDTIAQCLLTQLVADY